MSESGVTTSRLRRHERAAELIARLASKEAISSSEARDLVRVYYRLQKFRIMTTNQARALNKLGEVVVSLGIFAEVFELLEKQCESVLDVYTAAHPMGSWMRKIYGIGPVLSAGLLAHIDIKRVDNIGRVYSFAGLVPPEEIVYEPGKRRSYNKDLKVLCFKIGRSFVMFSGHPACYYGHLYKEIKNEMVKRNERGDYAETARRKLESAMGKLSEAQQRRLRERLEGALSPADLEDIAALPRIVGARHAQEAGDDAVSDTSDTADTEAGQDDRAAKREAAGAIWYWWNGRLTSAHLDLRARRNTVKIFLYHLCAEWARRECGRELPLPYGIEILGHSGYIPPPPIE